MTTEATIRQRHHDMQDAVVGGWGGMVRCICGTNRSDPDMECPTLEAEIDDFFRARLEDDGGPVYGAPDAR
jgi:hypothetical protein